MDARITPPLSPEDQRVRDARSLWSRAAILAYGIGSYLIGAAALVSLLVVMLGFVPFRGGPVQIESPVLAALFNVGFVVAFSLQHSVMARASFKARWIRIIDPSLERPTYVLATGFVLLPLVLLWQPLPMLLWSVKSSLARGALTGIALLGCAYLLAATFAIDHFELFGLQQTWSAFRGRAPASVPFRERWMYRFDRHPIMTGLLVGIWVTPEMTAGHLLFSAACTIYVVIGVHLEERSLRRQWGHAYEEYCRRAGTIVPRPWSR